MYKKYQLPKVFANYFDLNTNRSIYNYNTRGSNNLRITSVHNNYIYNFIRQDWQQNKNERKKNLN